MYNFIQEDGKLLLNKFAAGVWLDETGDNSFIIKENTSYSSFPEYSYYRLDSVGKKTYIGRNSKYFNKPVVDLYSYKKELTDRLILHLRLFSISIEDVNGKVLASGVSRIIAYNDRPISDIGGIPEGIQGSLFSVRREVIAEKEETLLSYDFATIQSADGYRILCYSTESLLPDIYEEVLVLKSVFIKVRKNGVWNIIDKFGDYVSKDMWFNEVELLNNGNAIVNKEGRFNFLKGNGNLLSQEWFDEVTPTMDVDKYVVRRDGLYNVMDSNLRLLNRKWQASVDNLSIEPGTQDSITEVPKKQWSTIQAYDPVWFDANETLIECYVLSKEMNKVIVLLPTKGKGKAVVREFVLSGYYGGDPIQTYSGPLYLNKPVR